MEKKRLKEQEPTATITTKPHLQVWWPWPHQPQQQHCSPAAVAVAPGHSSVMVYLSGRRRSQCASECGHPAARIRQHVNKNHHLLNDLFSNGFEWSPPKENKHIKCTQWKKDILAESRISSLWYISVWTMALTSFMPLKSCAKNSLQLFRLKFENFVLSESSLYPQKYMALLCILNHDLP